jgi:hypothetical protein
VSRWRPGARKSRRSSEHLADHSANSVITGPPVLLAAGNRGYRSPNVLGWVGYMGNVGYNLFRAGRLTNAAGGAIDEKIFIHLAIGQNAAFDKVQFFGEDREGPDKKWPAADDRAFMVAGQQIARRLPMDLVVALAEAMLNERCVERARILEIAAPFLE